MGSRASLEALKSRNHHGFGSCKCYFILKLRNEFSCLGIQCYFTYMQAFFHYDLMGTIGTDLTYTTVFTVFLCLQLCFIFSGIYK